MSTVIRRTLVTIVIGIVVALLIRSEIESYELANRISIIEKHSIIEAETYAIELQSSITVTEVESILTKEAERLFFVELVGSRIIADALLSELNKQGIEEPELFFALMMVESAGNPNAINRNKYSIDRGLFQLNSNSYPYLSNAQFYDIKTNIHYGVSHLLAELESFNENEEYALYAYNAGPSKVYTPPEMTVVYATKILALRTQYKADKQRLIEDTITRQLSNYKENINENS